jgi:hypothetical protein
VLKQTCKCRKRLACQRKDVRDTIKNIFDVHLAEKSGSFEKLATKQ